MPSEEVYLFAGSSLYTRTARRCGNCPAGLSLCVCISTGHKFYASRSQASSENSVMRLEYAGPEGECNLIRQRSSQSPVGGRETDWLVKCVVRVVGYPVQMAWRAASTIKSKIILFAIKRYLRLPVAEE